MDKLIEKSQSIRKLIEEKMMIVDTEHFHVSMLGELWNSYGDDKKLNLCENILNFCKLENIRLKLPNKDKPVLLVSIKDTDNRVAPYAYYRNGIIELVKDSDIVRKGFSSAKLFWKLLLKVLIGITLLGVILYFIL